MIKKWSYVAAAMLTVASGVALTSCIDNDEPFGIREIRLATANLLDAKKAAVEAEAAAKSAQVEIAKINAEIEKLRIENEKIEAQANADYRAAEARYLDALAEAEKLKAEGQKAKDDAEAARLYAEAEKAQAEAEQWKAQADAIRTHAQAKYEEAQQRIAEAQQKADDLHKKAEQKLAEAIYAFEKGKADNLNAWNKELWAQVETAFNIYLQTINDYNDANYQYKLALNHMAELEADLVWRNKGDEVVYTWTWRDPDNGLETTFEEKYVVEKSGFESPKYEKKKALLDLIAEKKHDIEGFNDNIEKLATYKQQLEDLTNSFNEDEQDFYQKNEWAVLLAEYDGKLQEAKAAVEQAKLEKELVKVDQADVFAKPAEEYKKYETFMSTGIEIEKYEIPQIPILAVLNSTWSSAQPVDNTGISYYLDKPDFYDWDGDGLVDPSTNTSLDPFGSTPLQVKDAESSFDKWIRDFKLAMLDDNDVLWTTATLNELERQLTQGDTDYAKALENWTLAKKVYNMGGTPDVSELPNEEALEAAIEAYNALGTKANELQDAYEVALNAWNEASYALTEAQNNYSKVDGAVAKWNKAQADFAAAVMAADAEFQKSISTASKEYSLAQQTIATNTKELYHKYQVAVLELQKLELNPDATAAQITSAKEAMGKAQENYTKYAVPAVDDKTGKPINGAAVDLAEADAAQEKAIKAATVAKQQAVLDARGELNSAEKAYLAAGGGQLVDKDPAYAPLKEAMDKEAAARQEWIDARDALNEFSRSEIETAYYTLKAENQKQLEGLGLYDWGYPGAIPNWMRITNYVNGYGNFEEASIPAMLLNGDSKLYQYTSEWYNGETWIYDYDEVNTGNSDWGSQVYANARWLVETTSYTAYGDLGTSYDVDDDMTFDWKSDKAFLLDSVDIDVLNNYITKWIMASNPNVKEEEINPFMLASHYDLFGAYGNSQGITRDIAYAKIVIENANNNAITEQIDNLTEARDAMLQTLEDKQNEAETLWGKYVEAYDDAKALTAEANKNLEDAVKLYNIYNKIVNEGLWTETGYIYGLQTTVDNLYNAEFSAVVAQINKLKNEEIPNLQGVVDREKLNLEKAQDMLAYYEYQLEQLEGDAYAKVENPYKYEVEYWESEVARISSNMEFWQKRYEELLQQYNDAKKAVDYPN